MGRRPYGGTNRREIRDNILARQVRVGEVPDGWGEEAGEFVNGMIVRNPGGRLGRARGMEEVKGHRWFMGFDWGALEKKEMTAPFIPRPIIDNP